MGNLFVLHVSSELLKGQDLSELCVERSAVGVEGSGQEQLPTIFFFFRLRFPRPFFPTSPFTGEGVDESFCSSDFLLIFQGLSLQLILDIELFLESSFNLFSLSVIIRSSSLALANFSLAISRLASYWASLIFLGFTI